MGLLIFYTLFTLIDLDNETDIDSGWPEWISVCSHLSVHAFGQRLSQDLYKLAGTGNKWVF